MSDTKERLARLTPAQRARLAERLARAADRNDQRPALPQVQCDPERRYEPFPLTDLQQAYWIGRSGAFDLGHVAGHSYLEVELDDPDPGRLETAWQRLIERHDMLRATIEPDGSQRVLPEVPDYRIEIEDLREATAEAEAERLQALWDDVSHQVLPSDRWPLFTIRGVWRRNGRLRLAIGLDALVIDGWSIAILFREWGTLYRDPDAELPPLTLTFRDYVLAERALEQTERYQRDRTYWLQRLDDLPPAPDLPLACAPGELDEERFVRRTGRLDQATWGRLKEQASEAGITPTAVLLAAYAQVIGLWSRTPRFTLNIPQFNRLPLHPEVTQVVGESASFSLLEVDLAPERAFVEQARRLQQQLWDDLDHGHFSGIRVLRELGQRRTAGQPNPVMPVVFTGAPKDAQGRDAFATDVARHLGEVVTAINQTPQVWLDNHVSEQDGALVCDWDSVDALFPSDFSETLFRTYLRHLETLATDGDRWQQPWATLAETLLPPEQAERRAAVNDRPADIPEVLLTDLFAEQAARHPAAPAVIAADRILSYGELDELANRWARRLRAENVQPDELVAVVTEKGWEQPVAVLGTLRAGAAYAPLDPEQPPERLRTLLADSGTRLVLTQARLAERLDWPAGVQVLALDREPVEEFSADPVTTAQTPDNLAYVIYTSGSTGKPKGVMIAHRGVVNAVLQTNDAFDIGPEDRVLGVSALHHDMSVYDLFGTLAAGAALVLPTAAGRKDPAHWSDCLRRHRVTVWNSVPAMMGMLLEYADAHPGALPDSLRLAFLGGDWIPVTLPERLQGHAARARVVSVGGPTETTMWNIWHPVDRVDPDWTSIPYGKPIANTTYHVLKEDLTPCPDWVPGELCCSGVGIAQGYWQDEARTAEKFIRHPRTGERLYRTGDLGRYRPDGTLEFLGRTDFQIKLQGQRIETGEIETALLRHAGVRAAVVAVHRRDNGQPRLVAYVVGNDTVPDGEALRAHLAARVPDYMVPAQFIPLEQLPLNPNGKVDRKALPVPEEAALPAAEPAADDPEGLQAEVVALVRDALGVATLEPTANLIGLGANSLDMVRIANRLEQAFGFQPRMDQIFRLQTVDAIAAYCEEQTGRRTGSAPGATGLEDALTARLRAFKPLVDPEAREAFKRSQPGVRRDLGERSVIVLHDGEASAEARRQRYAARRSHRRFSLQPVPLDAFSDLLSAFRQVVVDGQPKYLFASPGGLYPTQAYLHVKAGRVEGVGAGTYYYHPVEHRLVSLTPAVELSRDIHVPFVNTPIFDEAAFSVFLVADLAAIAPSYGERALHFATLEAGGMAATLEAQGQAAGVGLCQVGGVDFDRIRTWFGLTDNHVYLHGLLGGMPRLSAGATATDSAVSDTPADRATALVERIRELSEEEVRRLLAAHNNNA